MKKSVAGTTFLKLIQLKNQETATDSVIPTLTNLPMKPATHATVCVACADYF